MKTLKIFVLLLLSVTTFFCSSTIVNAEVTEYSVNVEPHKFLSSTSYNKALNKIFTNAWNTYQKEVDISSYKVKSNDFSDIYANISDLYPEYFYIDFDNTEYFVKSGYVSKVKLAYLYSNTKLNQLRKKLNKSVIKIISLMKGIKTEEDKVVFIHDYISTHNQYDPDGLSNDVNMVNDDSFTAYGCLVKNMSVCQGMSDAFILLCNKTGIKAELVNSPSMVHAWNIVRIDGHYYHLDITWDDSASEAGFNPDGNEFLNINGFASHSYFLKSDQQITSLNHYNWKAPYKANDSTTYQNYYWDGVYSHIYFIKGYQYYIKDSQLIKRNPLNNEQSIIYTIKPDITVNGWKPKNTVLAYDYTHNFLLMNLSDGIYAINLYNKNTQKVYDFPFKGFIAGISFFDKTLKYDAALYSSSKLTHVSNKIADFTFPDYEIEYGDVDGKDGFNIKDILELKKFLSNYENEINEFAADINEDNSIDIKDIVLLIKKAAEN